MPTIEIPEDLIPCRVCGAAPAETCVNRKTQRSRAAHGRRKRDALWLARALDW